MNRFNILLIIVAGCAPGFHPNLEGEGTLSDSETSSGSDIGTEMASSEEDSDISEGTSTDISESEESSDISETDDGGIGEMPGPGEDCSPIGDKCPDEYTCVMTGVMNQFYQFKCIPMEPDPSEVGGPCPNTGTGNQTFCNYGFCQDMSGDRTGFCEINPSNGCCYPWCNATDGMEPTCPEGMDCIPFPFVNLPPHIQLQGGVGTCYPF